MQLVALDVEEKIIYAHEAEKQHNYICMECFNPVRVRGGYQRQHHFFHLTPNRNCRQHQKGLIHLHHQDFFYQALPLGDCILEHRFPQINRIADIAWVSEKLVIEIQYSPISAEEVLQRNADYQSAGWDVLWILHSDHFNKKNATAAEVALQGSSHYYSCMNEHGEGYLFDQFSLFDESSFEARLPPLPIGTIFLKKNTPFSAEAGFLANRTQKWSHYMGGDILDLLQEHPDHSYLKNAKELHEKLREQSKYRLAYLMRQIHRGGQKALTLYKNLFHVILEMICR